VVEASMVYLFIAENSIPKDLQIKKIRQEFLSKDTEQFNLDILFARELTLKLLQEKLLCLPVRNPKRVVIIKEAQDLKDDIKEFILAYVKKPYSQVVLILDINTALAKGAISQSAKTEEFIKGISRYAKVSKLQEVKPADAFTLGRSISQGRPDYALRLLNQLIKSGERPERILGGLRYVCERDSPGVPELRKKFRLLLNCDIEIKTGKLKPVFALEKLVISLCSLAKPFH
jgi:DNA polymerase III delta subunit